MNDPWDVKSVRQSGQYLSCMKINGVPLLPPVLSKECRKEMQYYKLLAKEVEKRIALLQPYTIDTDTEGDEDITDATDLPESEQVSGMMEPITKSTLPGKPLTESPNSYQLTEQPSVIEYNKIKSKNESLPNSNSVMDLTLDLIGANKDSLDSKKSPQNSPTTEVPERDCESPKKIKKNKQLLTDNETNLKCNKQALVDTVNNFVDNILSDPFHELSLKQDGPSSLSSKSFTGSLNDLHTDSLKESHKGSKLIRQSSYTLLKPSPQLLAHLEVQSLNTGVEMTSISMSESLSNLSSRNKKRRSWDLESAKVKWSSMALELNAKSVPKANEINKNLVPRCAASPKKPATPSPQAPRAKSVTLEKPRRAGIPSKSMPKSEPIQKAVKRPLSPVKNVPSTMSHRFNVKEATSPKNTLQKKDVLPKPFTSESDDPATRVRELYEKIQQQQLAQMTSLVEKQKREQLLLQQVFEEQNNILFQQLKTICPKSPIEAKEAWVDKVSDAADRGPVSLSQLINQKSPDQSLSSPVSSTLTETHNYINHCDDVLKKSRDITGSLKKQLHNSRSQSSGKTPPKGNGEGTRTRTQSPTIRNTSRRLNYDTSVSSDRDCELILTDRTNDTLADLNVTFPSDYSDNEHSLNRNGIPNSRQDTGIHPSSPKSTLANRHIDAAIRNMEETLYNSIKNKTRLKPQAFNNSPSAKEREAATKIVAHAKGFLVRRLMRTERVQSTVQTIKDALLCALQLHQDRDGIRGADVDLHRRLIQQITAACYTLHDTFVASSPAERCAVIAADRGRKRALAARASPAPRPRSARNSDIMSQSHTGSFPARSKRQPASPMTQSNYETFSQSSTSCLPNPPRRPWR